MLDRNAMQASLARLFATCSIAGLLLLSVQSADALDWMRFRGPNGSGIHATASPPTTWDNEQNIEWRIDLPGPGSSSPILVGDKLFVTCWTGYGLSQDEPGEQENLARVLVCIDRQSGKTIWSKSIKAELPEDKFGGMFAQHGYASHTPVSDGENIYVFFGKTGAVAFDLDGNEQWRTDCGDGFGAKDWGSAASPVLHGNLLIVAAFAEDNALIALDKTNGKEVWRYELEGLDGVWGTPLLATSAEGRTDLVLAAAYKIIGLDPATGTELWTCVGSDNDTVSTSPIVHDDIVYLLTGRGGSVAVRVGGEGDVTDTHILWKGNHRGSIPAPIYHEDKIYWIGRNGMNCIDAATGDQVYQARFERPAAPEAAEETPPAQEGRRGRGGRGGGRFGSAPYASPVAAGDKFYSLSRSGETYVVRLGDEFEQLAANTLSDGGDFSSTPALVGDRIYVRSSKYLYSIRAEK